jgi:hypothetical protein
MKLVLHFRFEGATMTRFEGHAADDAIFETLLKSRHDGMHLEQKKIERDFAHTKIMHEIAS